VDLAAGGIDETEDRREPAVTVLVCETCREADGSSLEPVPGRRLAEATRVAAEGTGIAVKPVACLGNCKQRLSAAILRDGSWSYVFGNLTTDSGPDLVIGAELFRSSTDGVLPWRGRPDSLKRGMVARLPPLGLLKDD
jgi:predicted metal-binding protein